jgi:hypothetical protein
MVPGGAFLFRINVLDPPRYATSEMAAKLVGYGRHGAATGLDAPRRNQANEGENAMRIPPLVRCAFIALFVLFGVGLQAAYADSGSVVLTVFKGGWIIGGSAGHGTLSFRGRSYPLSVGGLDYGLVFGGSKTVLRGRVSNIQRASDIAGVYAAAGAGLAVGRGARAIVLTNQKGAVLELSGKQVGLMANVDLSGLAITMK